MGRAPCCSKVGLHRGPWTPREDTLLVKYIQAHGEGHWRSLPKKAGLLRCGKSCRLRWMNYLRPDIKRGNITPDEEDLIIRLHSLLGNRWSLIAGRLPGRTDNEIKNYWNTHLSKRLLSQGTDPNTHKKLPPDNPVVVLVPKKKRKNKSTKPTEQEKPKIHLPKPIRFTSSVCTTKSSSQGGENGQVLVPWSEYISDDENRTGFLCYNDDHDLINSSDFECQSHHDHDHDHVLGAEGDSNDSLEKIYEEYLQLLKTNEDQVQLDSFAESLLI
ncbi:hypothetical protein E1A91_D12G131500v1 [Gossypium mustelinum]|uniref:Uncharacterized protein n=1 Tax=Gossypium mustelinum TaxID=34275 RepID=A0A5D2SF79_GOSMU|nr:hypothetical protein E1A91_D12G131500v1 [Gossypium mustelinum]